MPRVNHNLQTSNKIQARYPDIHSDNNSLTLLNRKFIKAIKKGNVSETKRLLDLNCDVNQSMDGLPALTIAVKEKQSSVVRLFLKQPTIEVDIQDWGERPVLRHAAFSTVKIANMLLKTPNIELNPKDYKGYTPLLLAAANNFFEMTLLFVKTPGIDLNVQNDRKKSTLDYVVHSKKLTIKQKCRLSYELAFRGVDTSFIMDPTTEIHKKHCIIAAISEAMTLRIKAISLIFKSLLPNNLINLSLSYLK